MQTVCSLEWETQIWFLKISLNNNKANRKTKNLFLIVKIFRYCKDNVEMSKSEFIG
jgi:hypothetical protein